MWDQDQWVGVPGDPGQGNEGLSCRTLEHWSLLLFIDVLTLNLRPKKNFFKESPFCNDEVLQYPETFTVFITFKIFLVSKHFHT